MTASTLGTTLSRAGVMIVITKVRPSQLTDQSYKSTCSEALGEDLDLGRRLAGIKGVKLDHFTGQMLELEGGTAGFDKSGMKSAETSVLRLLRASDLQDTMRCTTLPQARRWRSIVSLPVAVSSS